jgi:hypothetical protein
MNKFDFISQELDPKLESVRKKAIQLSLMRLLVFVLLGASLILGLAEHPLWLIFSLVLGVFFIRLIQQFNFQKDQEAIYKGLRQIQIDREKRQKRFLSEFEKGSEFSEKRHPFASDLDLFGAHSLFQLLNHCFSPQAKKKLADFMKSDFSTEEVPERINTVRELASKPVFLEAMEAVGKAFTTEKQVNVDWLGWLKKKERKSIFIKALALIGPLGGIVILFLISSDVLPVEFLGLWVLFGILSLGMVFKALQLAGESIPLSHTLKSLRIRSELVENESFHSRILVAEKEKLTTESGKASLLLKELDSLGLWVQNRMNLLYIPFNLIFWVDFFLYIRLVSWKEKVGLTLSHVPENLENWEVFVSLGSFESELEGKGEVSLSNESILVAEGLNHPLILPEKSVANTLDLGEEKQVILLTGANMSGKTTFMRTLGINCVLANMGLSPFAKSFTFGNFQLFTSMRNSDNLGESVSSFYAELSRIKALITRLESGEPIFFLLDEILKGTNTEDRISGSKALIHQILGSQGFGIISTHDIELAELGQIEEKVHNYSFHSEIHDQTIHFDYLLKKGPCTSFNAHKLMELMGIKFG